MVLPILDYYNASRFVQSTLLGSDFHLPSRYPHPVDAHVLLPLFLARSLSLFPTPALMFRHVACQYYHLSPHPTFLSKKTFPFVL